MTTLFVMVGIPGSGKSYIATNSPWLRTTPYVSRDKIRYEFLDERERQLAVEGCAAGDEVQYFDCEDQVWECFVNRIVRHLELHDSCIADATHINRKSRKKLIDAVKARIPIDEVVFIVMDTPFCVCVERNNHRDGRARVPMEAMESMYMNFQPPKAGELGCRRVITISTPATISGELAI